MGGWVGGGCVGCVGASQPQASNPVHHLACSEVSIHGFALAALASTHLQIQWYDGFLPMSEVSYSGGDQRCMSSWWLLSGVMLCNLADGMDQR